MKLGLGVKERLEERRVELDAIVEEDGQRHAQCLVHLLVHVLLVLEVDLELGELGELISGGGCCRGRVGCCCRCGMCGRVRGRGR